MWKIIPTCCYFYIEMRSYKYHHNHSHMNFSTDMEFHVIYKYSFILQNINSRLASIMYCVDISAALYAYN